MLLSASWVQAGLLGTGTGEGSCPAAPFRAPAAALKWVLGCPAGAECCTEYGYCRSVCHSSTLHMYLHICMFKVSGNYKWHR